MPLPDSSNGWFIFLSIVLFFVYFAWPRYEFRARVLSPDGTQALMVYVNNGGILNMLPSGPGDWAYDKSYGYLVDANNDLPVASRRVRKCRFQVGEIYSRGDYRADWTDNVVIISKHASINRETGGSDCINW